MTRSSLRCPHLRARAAASGLHGDHARPAAGGSQPLRRRDQAEAIAAVMRLFVEHDLADGVPQGRMARCAVCRIERPAPGFVRYDSCDTCNACAVDYEISRARGAVRSIGEYLIRRGARPSA